MDPIPRERMGNATSLFNLMRNIGGSIGIAMTGTMLARNQQRATATARRERQRVRPGGADDVRADAGGVHGGRARCGDGDQPRVRRDVRHGRSGRRRWCRSSALFQLLGIVFLLLIPLVLLMKRPGRRRAGRRALRIHGRAPQSAESTEESIPKTLCPLCSVASSVVTIAQRCETAAVSAARLLNYSDEALARDRGFADPSPALAARCARPVRGAAPGRRPSPVVRRVARRRPHRSARARHPPGDRRRGARRHRRAGAGRHRTRPRAGGVGPVAREVRRARAEAEVDRDRRARCSRATTTLLEEIGARYGVSAADHRRHLGNRVELRTVQRRPADRRRARDARLGSATVGVLPRGAVRRARHPEPRRHRARAACADRGPARWARCSSCRRAT